MLLLLHVFLVVARIFLWLFVLGTVLTIVTRLTIISTTELMDCEK